MAQENLLEVKNLVVRYGGIEAVRGISFEVPRGQIVTLIGSNGAGKSCMFLALLYALFGAMQNKIKNEFIVNRYASDKDMRISLSFSVGKSEYRIARGL